MGVCIEERNKNKKIINEEAPLPVINKISPGEIILPELDDINVKPKVERILPSSIDINVKPTGERILPELNNINTTTNNIIKMKINIKEKDVNKLTKILYNIDGIRSDCDLKELNESNTELFIDGKQYKYKSYFIPKKEGIHEIKLIIKNLMKNCCCLFYGLSYLQSIDLSLFNTQNVTNMSYMFYNCYNLQSLDLSSFNTQNVTNMSYMFCICKLLTNLNISNFNTQNVTNMSYMFFECNNLQSIDLSLFNTKNVINMSCMFYNCYSLKNLDLFSFNTKNIKDIGNIFSGCKLERVVLSSDSTNLSKAIKEGLGSYFKKDTIVYA